MFPIFYTHFWEQKRTTGKWLNDFQPCQPTPGLTDCLTANGNQPFNNFCPTGIRFRCPRTDAWFIFSLSRFSILHHPGCPFGTDMLMWWWSRYSSTPPFSVSSPCSKQPLPPPSTGAGKKRKNKRYVCPPPNPWKDHHPRTAHMSIFLIFWYGRTRVH